MMRVRFFRSRYVVPAVCTVAPVLLVSAGALPLFAQAHASPLAAPVKVRARLDGFELAPNAGHAPNQIGGASRGLSVALYAPNLGKSYSQRPVFHWRSEDPGFEYEFHLMDDTIHQTVFRGDVHGGSFVYPESAPPLQPGRTYTWTVEPKIDLLGGSASASVTILGDTDRDRIAADLKGHDRDFAAARIFAKNGLWFDTVATYDALLAQHPDDPQLRRERAEVYASLPQTRELAETETARQRH